MRSWVGDDEEGRDVRAVVQEAVRATDEALRGLDRAERVASPESRVEIERVRAEVQHGARTILENLVGMIEVETGRQGHSRRVGHLAGAVAERMGLGRSQIIELEHVARLHDVGELLLDWEALAGSEELRQTERRTLRRHPTIGQRLLPTLGFGEEACSAVGAHHERLDGSGYPDRLDGGRVSIGAQILAVADSYEAMTHVRPHRTAVSSTEALRRLRREAIAGRMNREFVEALEDLTEGR